MPLAIEQESEDLLRQALETLRSRMSGLGTYAQDRPYDQLDRILSGGLGGNAKQTIDEAERIAPGLLRDVLGNQSGMLDRLNITASGSPVRELSGPMQLPEGRIGRVNLQTNEWVPIPINPQPPTLDQLPPGYSPSRFMAPQRPNFADPNYSPGFSFAGAPEDEAAARAAYSQTPEGGNRFLDEWQRWNPATPAGFDAATAEAIPVKGAPGLFYIPTAKGLELRGSIEEGLGGIPIPPRSTSQMRGMGSIPTFNTADDVKAAFAAGKLSREEAGKILRSQFGFK